MLKLSKMTDDCTNKSAQLKTNWGRKLKKASFIVSRTETFHNNWIMVPNIPEKTTEVPI